FLDYPAAADIHPLSLHDALPILQGAQILLVDAHLGQGSEAGVDAVGRRVPIGDAVDQRPRTIHPRRRFLGEDDLRFAQRHPLERLQLERVPIDDHLRARHVFLVLSVLPGSVCGRSTAVFRPRRRRALTRCASPHILRDLFAGPPGSASSAPPLKKGVTQSVALIVQKYGGTSVGSTERIRRVADRCLRTQAEGHDVVVVVSAMSGETNRLLELVRAISDAPSMREHDAVVSTGEQVSVGLLALAIQRLGGKARSFTGQQVRILTDSVHGKARIKEIDGSVIRASLANKEIVVVAGFQGVDANGDITTLGRGGSDTSAVAIAAALGADACEIYTDVEGVYTTDPNLVKEARR